MKEFGLKVVHVGLVVVPEEDEFRGDCDQRADDVANADEVYEARHDSVFRVEEDRGPEIWFLFNFF